MLLPVFVSVSLLACGAPPEESAVPAGERTRTGAKEDTARTGASLATSFADGEPMPPAESSAGIPPYPNAIVWTRTPRTDPDLHAFEAFTPDSWEQVEAFYDERLKGWEKIRAKDMVIYEKGDDAAAITVSPWRSQDVPAEASEVLKRANTAIGVAWRR